ncbi:putative lipid transporter atnI [Pseudocercospora fuligena]|uniref:Putative lipid transporter atnI n=1 Tax=Pseudocercospora fuligena TaxID=685502 RepID=A0A8H6RED1_9PEZI|nr:putative lipid transporter atnI [Pseudocercospora fuligena]
MAKCNAITDPNSIWTFCPNIGAAYLFAVLFGLITISHIIQAIGYRKLYSLVIIISAMLQTATYILRVLSIQHVTNDQFYTYWFVFMMIAPIFTNGYAYMVQGRMVYNFTASARIFRIPAWRFGLIFVLLDIVAFLIQATGAVIASGQKETKSIMLGLHIYMGGIAVQQICIFVFMAIAIRFHLQVRRQAQSQQRARALTLVYVQYAVMLLITVRIIFRLIEYSAGMDSTIPNHEAYQYVFDSSLMMVALVLYNVWHPGRTMPGREASLPSRKMRKALKKAGTKQQGRMYDLIPLNRKWEFTDSLDGVEDQVKGHQRPSAATQGFAASPNHFV